MKRHERTRNRAARLSMIAIRRAMRATNYRNKTGRGAIRDGKLADSAWTLSRGLFQLAEDQERAASNEKSRKSKMPTDWWMPKPKQEQPAKKSRLPKRS